MVTALVMATVDRFPGMPAIPTAAELERPLMDLAIAFVGSIVGAVLFARFLPSIPVYRRMVGSVIPPLDQSTAEVLPVMTVRCYLHRALGFQDAFGHLDQPAIRKAHAIAVV